MILKNKVIDSISEIGGYIFIKILCVTSWFDTIYGSIFAPPKVNFNNSKIKSDF